MNELNDHSSRAHAKLSASSSHRWLNCPYSATVAAKYPPQDTLFTREGTTAHEVAEAVASGKWRDPTPATVCADADMLRHAEEYRDYIESLKSEGTLVMLETRLDFSEWVPDGFGTADCILLHGDTMDVIDYKYGQGVAVSAIENPQMMLYGLGAVAEYGFAYDITNVRLHIFQPRINNISVYETTMEALLAWGEVIVKPAAKKAASGLVEMHAGEHCRFCPHGGRCPELATFCMDAVEPAMHNTPDSLQPGEVANFIALEPIITMWLKKVKDRALTDLLDGKTIPGYKVVEGKLGNRKWKDEIEVVKALEAAGIAQDAYTVLKLLSPAEMDKSLGKKRAADLLADLIDRAPGSPTVVPENDKRPAYDRKAETMKDFD